ncbi:dihydroorotase [Danxiaibacter flavus]|uniref:Dihydroorotase n=1 Tax=Danxiaibacter flavus TaxID=3049108 RepID=A0ABV3ZJI6_9BACT|nr:dihydroorotase [Chitinophagaceae bacterium DXS]
MNILLRKVTIADPVSAHNSSVKDIFISNGIIQKIADNIDDSADQVVDGQNTTVSPGWVDIFAHFADPGYEFKETLESGANTAAAGGFTRVFVLPNTNPVVQNKTQVEYIVQKSSSLPVYIQPLGSITKNGEGKELAEMYDMQASGAAAFSDGTNPVQSAGLLVKALQYVKAFNGVVVQVPMDKSIGQYGLINEGVVSTRLGLPGIPAMAEEIIIERDLKLAQYANSSIHFTGVSTAKSLEYIREAKEAGIQVTCSVTPYHLYFNDEDLASYDTNLKVTPPIRNKEDVEALKEGVRSGLVDCIASHHLPQDWDNKVCEFEYAKAGMLGLQTAYAVVQSVLPDLSANKIAALFSSNARSIFHLSAASIEEGSQAELTLFKASGTTTLAKETNKSKSSNSPFFDKSLKGEVVGIINKGNIFINK